ncbi:hypothetical protein SAMN04489806_3278 [Paramicrobacterium humi]|uniref:Transglycosylase SLT domain-containing protein n=1 Tax=Paramicrobacterium humi TaxID=640635 RepID=A0A1H4TPM1_9MICO|nr:lytic transglycosylase domain-containing protein [Microbacterium humi]SEC58436.1 hypothetical protein SAMN04489806_3278 [Microbacterium humi]
MGKHVAKITPAIREERGPRQRPRTRRTLVLGLFSFLAAFGFIAVNVVDPYSGATASPYFQMATTEQGAAQSMVVAGSYETAVARDGYDAYVKEKPKPKPKPVEKTTTRSSGSSAAPVAGTPDPGSAKAIAYDMVMARGWGTDQYNCLVSLWQRESGWNVYAHNGGSGAYGIPQALPGSKMASAGPDWQSNPATQISWGLGYISGRYGSPCGAWSHSQATGWY